MRPFVLAPLAGLLMALSVPPFGWWPLAVVGLALLYEAVRVESPLRRGAIGWVAGFVFFGIGLWWMSEFTAPGAVIVWTIEAVFVAVAAVLTPPGRGRALPFPGAVMLGEVLRGWWPVEGLPLAGISLGQVAGPLAPAARIGGGLLLLGLVAALGAGLAEALRRRPLPLAAAVVGAIVFVGWGAAAAPGGGGRVMEAALVQGGGQVGFRASQTDAREVYRRHLSATEEVEPGLDLVMWPEDVVDVEGPVLDNPQAAQLGALAADLDATLVVGVVEGVGPTRFRNAAVAWGPDGEVVGRYDKVRRVPMGEYVPWRRFVDRIGDLSDVPRDAIPGEGPGLLRTPAGELGVLISYEVFFNDRLRHAVNAGAQVVLVPTNAASFTGSQVPTQELSAARLRAVEGGRWVLQAGPTGYTAVIDADGTLRDRTVLSEAGVLRASVPLLSQRTPFVRWGDAPLALIALGLAAAGLVVSAREARRTRPS